MELYQLRSFATIADLGQLTRAAAKLHVSQPALSAQLRGLEDEFGLALFERTPSGMVLTAAGARLRAEAEKILAAAAAMQAEVRALKGELAGRVSIGTLSDPAFIRVGEFMSLATARHPLLALDFHQGITGETLDAVRDGALDASFYYGELKYPTVVGLPLREVVYRVAVPIDWCQQLAGATWADIAQMPWIIPPPISSHHKLAHTLLREHGVAPAKVVEADQEAVITSLVVSGVGIALMREDFALEKAAAAEICLWDDVEVRTTLWFITQRDRAADPSLRAVLELLREVWGLDKGTRVEAISARDKRKTPG